MAGIQEYGYNHMKEWIYPYRHMHVNITKRAHATATNHYANIGTSR